MPTIDRRNILDLIGKHRGKYHSCIITCYSLDFSFFEERVLPVLRTANIKNVNIIADGKFLELAQATTTGEEFKYNKTYNFQPVYTKGVFHPKIMLLTGTKHGLLIIGSGNITSSGLSTNDEIWGAFHFDNIENENAPLFTEVWIYLQQFLNDAVGFIPQKIDWIQKYSPWIKELPQAQAEINLASLKQTVSFISNSDNQSIFQQIIDKVPGVDLQSITVISPYFDKQGEILRELYNQYTPPIFNCILDIEYGSIPKDLDPQITKEINFYNWKDCKKDYIPQFNRLHAKIIHFQFKDGLEYLMLGSANATNAGMGSKNLKAINHEASIILKRNSNITWIKELKIDLPKNRVSLASLDYKPIFNDPLNLRQKHTAKLVYSELRGAELNVYIKDYKEIIEVIVQIYTRDSSVIESLPYKIDDDKIVVGCKYPDEVFKICLVNEVGDLISNYCIVHRFEALLRCNPDPNHEKLDSFLDQDYPDGEGVTEMLTFIDHNWADEETEIESKYKQGGITASVKSSREAVVSHEKLSADKFNMISEEMKLRQSGELSNANVKIAEFLGVISSAAFRKSDDDFKESEEQKLFIDTEQKGEGDDIPKSSKTRAIGRKEKSAIARYFKKLHSQYNERLTPFFESRALSVTPKEKLTIKVTSNILIALQLIQIYYGKKYSIEAENEYTGEKEFIEETYLQEGDLNSDCDTVKGFLIDVYGKFLLLSTAGMECYDYEILNHKLSYNRRQVLYKSLFITLNTSWLRSELHYRDTILLNTLYYINPDPISDESFLSELKDKIEDHKLKAKYVSGKFSDNYSFFINSIIPKFKIWISTFNNKSLKENIIFDTNSINIGSMIFNSKIGFNSVYKISKNSNLPLLDLSRAGYEWDENLSCCLWKDITFTNKCIGYSI